MKNGVNCGKPKPIGMVIRSQALPLYAMAGKVQRLSRKGVLVQKNLSGETPRPPSKLGGGMR